MRTYQVEPRELAEQETAVVRSTLAVDEIGPFVSRAIGAVSEVLAEQGTAAVGPPFARYHRLEAGRFDVEAGFPTGGPVEPADGVLASTLPGGPVAVLAYVGPYEEEEEMEAAYAALAAWIAARGGAPTGDPWEVYLSDPAQEPDPGRWRTDIVMPFRIRPAPVATGR